MKKYKEVERIVKDEELISTNCDICKKEITDVTIKESEEGCYYNVCTHHSDWGNDSCESLKYFDFCSLNCLIQHMLNYFKKANGSEEYDIERLHRLEKY